MTPWRTDAELFETAAAAAVEAARAVLGSSAQGVLIFPLSSAEGLESQIDHLEHLDDTVLTAGETLAVQAELKVALTYTRSATVAAFHATVSARRVSAPQSLLQAAALRAGYCDPALLQEPVVFLRQIGVFDHHAVTVLASRHGCNPNLLSLLTSNDASIWETIGLARQVLPAAISPAS